MKERNKRKLELNSNKTEITVTSGRVNMLKCKELVRMETLTQVNKLLCLETTQTDDGKCTNEIKPRLGKEK